MSKLEMVRQMNEREQARLRVRVGEELASLKQRVERALSEVQEAPERAAGIWSMSQFAQGVDQAVAELKRAEEVGRLLRDLAE